MFTAVLGTLGLLGALDGSANPPVDLVIVTRLDEGIDREHLIGLADALESSLVTWPLIFTLLLIAFGRIAIRVLLWRAGVGPRWM